MTSGAGTDATLLDALFTPEGQANPYPLYRALLDAGPVHQGPEGAWYVVGYEACRRVLLDRGCGCRPGEGDPQGGRLSASMVMHDPPEHARLRRAVSWAFTPPEVEPLRDRIAGIADRAIDGMLARGGGDAITELAYPLPAAVIGEVLGISPGDTEQFRALAAVGVPRSAGEQAAREADARLEACFTALIEGRRDRPVEDVLGRLVAMCDGDGALTEEELTSTVMLLYIAGVLTTTSFIGNALLALDAHPEVTRRLRADPSLLLPAVEEVLRWDNPVPVVARNVFEPVVVDGHRMEPGDRVVVVLGAGNRDPRRFEDPDRFLIDRPGNVPLSFGWGVHRCLGAHLARLEGEIVLGRLLERCASVEVLEPDPPRLPGLMIRGPASLPVRLVAR
ncbi:MAG TPA: cytochrome P450 [Actinomycetota bacterium]